MPQIKDYTSNVSGLQITERGVDARLQEARRTGAFYNQAADAITGGARAQADAAGDVAKNAAGIADALATMGQQQETYAGHREISAGSAAGAKLFSDLNDQWDAISKRADPNDPSVAAKFRETVLEPALDKFKDAYGTTDLGQKWSEQHVESWRSHFFQKTAADMSGLAADAVRVNITQLGNASSNTARKNPDLHTVDFLLDSVPKSVDAIIDSSPNLRGAPAAKARMELTEKMREGIVKAGALGAMEKSGDPEKAAQTFADRYPTLINGQEIDQFAKMARYYKRVGESEDRAARVQGDYVAKKDFNDKINRLEMSTAPQNAGDPPVLPKDYWSNLRELSTHPGAALEPGRLKTMVTNGEAITRALERPEPLGRTSHDTTMSLLGRIRATDDTRLTDNSAIYEAYGNGKLSRADFNFLNNEFTQMRSPEGEMLGKDRAEFFKRWAPMIDGAMNDAGIHSLLGTQKTYEFEMDARRQEADLRKKGLDPHLAYDPRSEYFVGRPENIAKYHITLQEANTYKKTFEAMDKVKDKNLTGPGKTVTGVETINQPPGAKTFVPPNNWQYSASRNQYRDPSGALYDVSGNKVK